MPDETRTQGPPPAADATLNFPGASAAAMEAAHAPAGYQLEAELGRGGMGVVYRAKQTGLNRTVALKMVLAGAAAGERERIRFLAEAEAVAAIRHPHVVQVYDFGDAGGRPFLAMEFLSGGSLAQRLKGAGERDGTSPTRTLIGSGSAPEAPSTKTRVAEGIRSPFSPTEAAELVRKLALAVQAAHEQQIVHRDLKPGNVLFDAAGEPRVTDFGLAKKTGGTDLTGTQAIMGTPAYMAPEQARGGTKFVGPAADVYSLGVLLFECLAGRRPFESDDQILLLRQVAEERAPSVRSFAAVPTDLSRVVEKCLAKEPAERYSTASALADDLGRFLAGEPVTARRAGRWDRGVKWVKRNPGTAALLGSLAAALVIGTFVSLVFAFEARTQKKVADANLEEMKRLAKETDDALQKAMHAEARAVAERLKAEDTLCRSRYEEARALRLAGQLGWRETSLQRLAESSQLRQKPQSGSTSANVPDLADIRGETLAALVRMDGRLERTLASGMLDGPLLSGDGKVLISRFNKTQPKMTYGLRGYEPATGRELFSISESLDLSDNKTTPKFETQLIQIFNSRFAVNSDGSRLICSSLGMADLMILDPRTAKAVRTLSAPKPEEGAVYQIHSYSFSPDDRLAAAWGTLPDKEHALYVWDLNEANPQPRRLARHRIPAKKNRQIFEINHIPCGFTPGGGFWYALNEEPKLHVLDLKGSPLAEHVKELAGIHAIAWHPTAPRLAVLRRDADAYFVETHDWKSWTRLTQFPLPASSRLRRSEFGFMGRGGEEIAYSRDGRWLGVCGERCVHLFDGATGATAERFDVGAMEAIQSVAWTADHALVIKPVMESIQIRRIDTERDLRRTLTLTAPVRVVTISPDRRYWIGWTPAAAGNKSKRLYSLVLIDSETGAMTNLPEFDFIRESPRFRPDGRVALLASAKALVEVSIPEGRELRRVAPPKLDGYSDWSEAFYLPDGRLVATLQQDSERKKPAPFGVWDVDGRRFLFQMADLTVRRFGMQEQTVASDGRSMLLNPNQNTMPFDLFSKGDNKQEPWRLIGLPDGRPMTPVPVAHQPNVMSFPYALSNAGRRLIMFHMSLQNMSEMGMGEFMIHVLNLPAGDVILRRPIKPSDEDSPNAAFDESGSLLVLAPTAETIELWRLDPSPTLLLRWQPFAGQRIANVGLSGSLLYLRADGGNSFDLIPLDALNRRLQAMGLGW